MRWGKYEPKRIARHALLFNRPESRNSIWLPGWDDEANDGAFCIQNALKMGVLSLERSQIICVEKNKKWADKIQNKVSSLGFKNEPKMFVGELHNLPLTDFVDYANLDLLGNFNRPLAHWMHDSLLPKMTKNGNIDITIMLADRGYNTLIDALEERVRNDTIFKQFLIQVYHAHFTDNMPKNRLLMWAHHMMIIRMMLANHTYDLQPIGPYKNTRTPMMAIKISNIKPNVVVIPPIRDLLSDDTANRIPQKGV